MEGWTTIFRVGLEHRAQIVMDVLRDRGIDARKFSKKDSAYGFGFIEVQVPADHAIRATKIVEEEIKFE